MRVLAGTSGYAYKEWKGSFYPEDMRPAGMLRFYSGRLPAVEINNTFYRMPQPKVLAGWAEQVPDSFRFALKASQRITHRLRLKDAGDSVEFFFRTASTLGDRLGPVLFQLPPNFRKDLERLEQFLSLLPSGARCAFEFRHDSWFDEDVFGALAARGAALCVAEDETLATPLRSTTDWGYLRLRRQDYGPDDLAQRAGAVRSQPWSDAYVFFKHEDEATGPAFASRFLEFFPATNP